MKNPKWKMLRKENDCIVEWFSCQIISCCLFFCSLLTAYCCLLTVDGLFTMRFWKQVGLSVFLLVAFGVLFGPPSASAAFDCARELGGTCKVGAWPCDSSNEVIVRGTNCPALQTCCVPKPTAGICTSSLCQTSCPSGVDTTKSCSDNSTACCRSSGNSTCPSGICMNDEGSCTGGVDTSGSCPGKVCCKAPSSGTTCSGKDTSGKVQTGACSMSATCSSGTALTGATGCASGMACCYSAPPGSSCDMSKCSTSSCTQGTNNSLCAAECKSHFGTSGEYFYCETTQGGSGSYCSGSENPGIVPCGRSCDNPTTADDETKICTLCHLLVLMRNITDWIFMVMTYIAFAVLVAMGILYIVSTGKPQLTGMAKSGIWAALVGFAIVLLGWVAINVLLFVLADGALGTDTASFSVKTNGKWFEYSCDTQTKYTGTGGTGTGGSGTTPTGDGGNLNCKDGKCAKKEDVANAAKSNASGVEADILMAIVDAGEGCNKSVSSDGYGSCGYSQALPSIRTKCGITGSASESCSKIQNNVQLDLNCAAWLIKDNAGRCGLDIRNVASCYNSGKPNNCANTTNRYCDRVETYYKSCKS